MKHPLKSILCVALTLEFVFPAFAQDPMPPKETLEGVFLTQEHYSPLCWARLPRQGVLG